MYNLKPAEEEEDEEASDDEEEENVELLLSSERDVWPEDQEDNEEESWGSVLKLDLSEEEELEIVMENGECDGVRRGDDALY